MFSFKFKMKIAILTVLIAVTASECELCAVRIQGSRVGSEGCREVGWGGEQGGEVCAFWALQLSVQKKKNICSDS